MITHSDSSTCSKFLDLQPQRKHTILSSPLNVCSSSSSSPMEALISHFTLLSDQALADKSFDPSTIEDLMRLFEIESYKAWAALESEQQRELDEAEESLREAEEHLDREMEMAMEEYRRTVEEMERMAATAAAKRYMAAAMNSAAASMRSAWKAASGNKVHPS